MIVLGYCIATIVCFVLFVLGNLGIAKTLKWAATKQDGAAIVAALVIALLCATSAVVFVLGVYCYVLCIAYMS